MAAAAAAREIRDAIGDVRTGAIPERRLGETVGLLNQRIKGHPEEQALCYELRQAVRHAQDAGKRRSVRSFRETLAAQQRDGAPVEHDELELLGAANQRLHTVYERQAKSLELVSTASEALASVQQQYSTVHSNLGVTSKIINQLWDKERSDDFYLRGALAYLLLIGAYIVATRVFGLFYWLSWVY